MIGVFSIVFCRLFLQVTSVGEIILASFTIKADSCTQAVERGSCKARGDSCVNFNLIFISHASFVIKFLIVLDVLKPFILTMWFHCEAKVNLNIHFITELVVNMDPFVYGSEDVREQGRLGLASKLVKALEKHGVRFEDASDLRLGIISEADFIGRLRVIKMLASGKQRHGHHKEGKWKLS